MGILETVLAGGGVGIGSGSSTFAVNALIHAALLEVDMEGFPLGRHHAVYVAVFFRG